MKNKNSVWPHFMTTRDRPVGSKWQLSLKVYGQRPHQQVQWQPSTEPHWWVCAPMLSSVLSIVPEHAVKIQYKGPDNPVHGYFSLNDVVGLAVRGDWLCLSSCDGLWLLTFCTWSCKCTWHNSGNLHCKNRNAEYWVENFNVYSRCWDEYWT